MSDPRHPGTTPPGADSDATMIRSTADLRGGDSGATRADRVREWVRRNNRGRDNGDLAQPHGHQEPVGPDSYDLAEHNRRASSTPQSAPSAASVSGRQYFRVGRTDHRSQGDPDATSIAEPEAGDPDSEQGGFMSKMKAHAKTVSAGLSGAAAGAMGSKDQGHEQTGAAADAVPAPETHEETHARKSGVARRTRKARLRLSQVDPWSVMKTAFLFSVAAGIVLWVATGTVWAVISSSGMFEEINRMVGDIIQTPGDDTPFRIQDYINTSKVMGTAALVAVIDVVIFTALATLGAFLYNLASAMIGGLEVTLAED